MAVTDYLATPSSNTAIAGINIGENCPRANVNDAIRQLMADLKTLVGPNTAALTAIAGYAEATAAEYRAATASRALSAANVWAAGALVTLTDAATIAVDMSTFINGTVTLAGNRAMGAPSNTKVGQSGVIYIVQDATGSRTLSYNAVWKFAGGTAPVLTTTANAVDALYYYVRTSTFIHASLVKDIK
jgi:hypothetical protein